MSPAEAERKAAAITRVRALPVAPHPLDLALADAQTREDIAQALSDLEASWARAWEAHQRRLAAWLGKVRSARAWRRYAHRVARSPRLRRDAARFGAALAERLRAERTPAAQEGATT